MEEKKDIYIEEYKINIKHHKILKKYGILIIICLLIVLFFLIITAISKYSNYAEQIADYFLYILLVPLVIMFLLFIPFCYHLYKGGICPNCKKYMDRGSFIYCRFCGVKLQ